MQSTRNAPAYAIEDLNTWLNGLSQITVWFELAVLAVCVLLAWTAAGLLRQALGLKTANNSVMFGRRVFDGALFPILLLVMGYLARTLLAQFVPLVVFKVVIAVLVALVMIRLGVKVLQVTFTAASWVRTLERTISWLAWGGLVLWISGLLPVLLVELDAIEWKVGASALSLRTLIEGALTTGAVMILMLWVSSALETRLLKSAVGNQLSLRKALANATRTVLLFFGLIFALSAVGIDLTALSVLGGAVGVGIGFGLQKLAANYVSGFVILAERSMRIGDNVRIDNFEGRITDITTRYTAIRSPTGRESIVPNEMLITNRVENLSLADPRIGLFTTVSVGYESDVDLVRTLLVDAALKQPRVLQDPAPSVALSAFGADGLEFTLGFWVADPENGQLNIRSDINFAILRALREHSIEIPYPQRTVHIRSN